MLTSQIQTQNHQMFANIVNTLKKLRCLNTEITCKNEVALKTITIQNRGESMKTFLLTLVLVSIGMTSFAREEDVRQCMCKAITKVCTLQQNGTQQDVYLTLFKSDGNQINSTKLANGISLNEALQILNSNACN